MDDKVLSELEKKKYKGNKKRIVVNGMLDNNIIKGRDNKLLEIK